MKENSSKNHSFMDNLSVIAPGFRISFRRLKGCEAFLRTQGVEKKLSSFIFGKDLLFSHNKKARLHQLKNAVKKGGLIWCLRGGYGSIELLEGLSQMKKPSQKSLLLGYSDITALHAFFHEKWNWPTLHGPLLEGVSESVMRQKDIRQLKGILSGGIKSVEFSLKPLNTASKKLKKPLKGLVKGGNLSVLQTLIATPWQPKLSGAFLFLEDINEKGYQVHRMLVHLEQSGMLKGVKAILLGSFLDQKEPRKLQSVLKKWAEENCQLPVFSGLPCGHGRRQATLPMNTKAHLFQNRLKVSTESILSFRNYHKTKRI